MPTNSGGQLLILDFGHAPNVTCLPVSVTGLIDLRFQIRKNESGANRW
jgi:hypothetical protein